VSVPARLEERFRIRSYEVEPDGRLRLVVLGRMLQEAAWQHAQMLGKGFAERESGALFWVLSRLRLRMDRYPRWGDEFTVRTWPVGTEKLLAVREFALLDGDRVLGRATSGWLVVDGTSGRPVRPQKLVADLPVTPTEFNGDLARLPDLSDAIPQDPRIVQYHDIDQYRHANNTAYLEWMIDAVAAAVRTQMGAPFDYRLGVMVETPRAALRAGEIAQHAAFLSFGTNDLTQMTYGLSRDDAGRFMNAYVQQGVYPEDPFHILDVEGVGELLLIGAARGRETRPNLTLSICGEHGGNPESIAFCRQAGFDYVSCSPYRVPVARLAAAHLALADRGGGDPGADARSS